MRRYFLPIILVLVVGTLLVTTTGYWWPPLWDSISPETKWAEKLSPGWVSVALALVEIALVAWLHWKGQGMTKMKDTGREADRGREEKAGGSVNARVINNEGIIVGGDLNFGTYHGSVPMSETPGVSQAPAPDTTANPDTGHEQKAEAAEQRPAAPPPARAGDSPRARSYPADIEYFLSRHASDQWGQLSDPARDLLRYVGIKLEPIVTLSENLEPRTTEGFEMLAYGPNGEGFGPLMARAGELGIPEPLLRLSLFIAGLRTAADLRTAWQRRHPDTALNKRFTINVDRELLASDLLRPAIKSYYQSPLNLEVNEQTGIDEARRFVELKLDLSGDFELELALDDGDVLDKQDQADQVRLILEPHLAFSKIDQRTTRTLLGQRSRYRPERLVARLKSYAVPERPFVIEGVEDGNMMDFLKSHWPHEDTPLWIQGWAVRPADAWLRELQPIHPDPRQPRGYVMV